MERLRSAMEREPRISSMVRGSGTGLVINGHGHDKVWSPTRKMMLDLLRISESVEKRLIIPDKNLPPTSAFEVSEHWLQGNAIIIRDGYEALAYTAYTERLNWDLKVRLGLSDEAHGLSELYCVVVDKDHRGNGMGTTIVYELIRKHYEETKDITSFITHQEGVVALFSRVSKVLAEEGLNITFGVFSGEQLPMLYPFLTLVNPKTKVDGRPRYTPEDIRRIEETNPRFRVRAGVLAAVNNYLSGRGPASFDLEGTNMMFVSNLEEAMRTDAELKKIFTNTNTLKEALIDNGYSI